MSPLASKQPQKPYIIGSLGPRALKYESFEGKAHDMCTHTHRLCTQEPWAQDLYSVPCRISSMHTALPSMAFSSHEYRFPMVKHSEAQVLTLLLQILAPSNYPAYPRSQMNLSSQASCLMMPPVHLEIPSSPLSSCLNPKPHSRVLSCLGCAALCGHRAHRHGGHRGQPVW